MYISFSAPPSACTQLQIVLERTRATTITVKWDRPEITGREDFYYNIFYSEDNHTFVQHNPRPYIKQDAVVDYALSGLKALTMYTVRVSVENGVSGQDERKEINARSCEITGLTGDDSEFIHSCITIVFAEQFSIVYTAGDYLNFWPLPSNLTLSRRPIFAQRLLNASIAP